ncbi:glycosyltransferase [Flavobacteriaceae bacterium 3-367]
METISNKLLIIGFVWPEPNSTAAGSRMLQLIHFFIAQGYELTFASTATKNEHSVNLSDLGVKERSIRLNHDSFDDFIKELAPQIVLFDRFMVEEQFGWRVAEYLPKALRILDTEDIHSLRTSRETQFKAGLPFSERDWLLSDMAKREIASIYRSDLSLIISSHEMELLQKTAKIDTSLLLHLPFMITNLNEEQTTNWLPFEPRKDFICIGSGRHAPNIDAVVWLKNEIWPLIRAQLPKADLRIYGSYLPESITQLHRPADGFYVMGRAKDAMQVMANAKVSLAPLRFGAGIKGKLAESMLVGTPNVTTSIGAEGMCEQFHWNGKIENDPTYFANAAVQLYQDRKLWEQAQKNGTTIINQCYDKALLEDRLGRKIEKLLRNLDTHRDKNLIGVLLLHHTMASTKYMAKWIGAKNRAGGSEG